jgi:histidyl-tRNA synthetase
MIPDAELLSLLCTILTKLDVGEFTIKVLPRKCPSTYRSPFDQVNHRKILDGIFEVCGSLPRKYVVYPLPSISLTKWASYFLSLVIHLTMLSIQLPWAKVREEMTEQKGLDPSVADKIGEYVKHKGVSHLRQNH